MPIEQRHGAADIAQRSAQHDGPPNGRLRQPDPLPGHVFDYRGKICSVRDVPPGHYRHETSAVG
jgi:hypothetical protein